MTPPEVAPYGSWRSRISAESLTASTVFCFEPRIAGEVLYWLESRPTEGGRVVLVRRATDGSVTDVTPAPLNLRSRVHEYGGGAYAVADSVIVFCHFDDCRVYRVDLSSDGTPLAEPRPITPAGGLRFGGITIERRAGVVTGALAVCEDHSGVGPDHPGAEAVNRLVRLDLDGPNEDGGTVLASGTDFVACGTTSPDGRHLAWMRWNHPNMPWDDSELCVAVLDDDGRLASLE